MPAGGRTAGRLAFLDILERLAGPLSHRKVRVDLKRPSKVLPGEMGVSFPMVKEPAQIEKERVVRVPNEAFLDCGPRSFPVPVHLVGAGEHRVKTGMIGG